MMLQKLEYSKNNEYFCTINYLNDEIMTIMKKTRLLMMLLALLLTASSNAQDSYREAVKDYWSFTVKDQMTNQMDSALKSSNSLWFESADLDLDQLTDRYLDERLMDYMTDFILPKIKELGVSEAALRENMALRSSPAGMTYAEHYQRLSEVLKGEIVSIMRQDSLKIMNGDTSNPVQIKAGIDAGYVEKFKEILDDEMINSLMGSFDQYANVAAMIMKDNPEELSKIQNMLTSMKVWMTANAQAIVINNAYGIITEEDLDFAAKLKALDTYKLMSLLPIMGGDMMSMGYGIIMDYIKWMEDHGVVANEFPKKVFNEMLKKGNGN